MKLENLCLVGIEDIVSDESYSSDFIEERLSPTYEALKLPSGRLELMTGIQERKLWSVGTKPSDLSIKVGQKAIESALINKNDIGLLVHCAVCRDFLEPSTASVVHHGLGLGDHTQIFDLSNACLGMMNGIVMAGQLVSQKMIKYALLVSGENASPLLEETIKFLNENTASGKINRKNIKKYIANLTIGSGSSAILLGHVDDHPNAPRFVGAGVATDSSANTLCQGDGDRFGLMMETDSEKLMNAGVKLAIKNWSKTKDILNWKNEDVDWVLTHQVGKAHEELTLNSLKLSETKTYKTYPYLGNTGSSALPITLSHLKKSKQLKDGDRLALMGIGSGLTSLIMGLEWNS